MTAIFMHGGCASLKEYTMQYQDQSTLALQTACLIQQNQMLKQQNAMLRDLMDHVDAVGDRLWRMDRRLTTAPGRASGEPRSAVCPAGPRARRHDLKRWGLWPLSICMSQDAHTPIR